MPLKVKMLQLLIVLTLCLSALPFTATAQQILSVENHGNVTHYTFEDLLKLPQVEVTTSNDYVNEATTFSGPTLRSVLEQNGIGENDEIELHALNDFFIVAPAQDAYAYDVILAILKNGEKMSVRNKGPIWVIYPMSDYPELRGDVYNGRLVWQLDQIIAQ
ncbi:molybdopterin-dependent oxidoreductase [Roseovarius aestuarii]|nr:molybdopterin-dependent oxidoreductase [Roseovarius aestuarii]